VIGTGWIAERFVEASQTRTAQQVVAVGSRTAETARGFAERFDIAKGHGSDEDLVSDPDVDQARRLDAVAKDGGVCSAPRPCGRSSRRSSTSSARSSTPAPIRCLLAHWVLGTPSEIVARGRWAPSGVNSHASALLVHEGGGHSVITTSIFSNTPTGATIAGSHAALTIPGIYYRPGRFTVEAGDHSRVLTYDEERCSELVDRQVSAPSQFHRRLSSGLGHANGPRSGDR
jgi:predicted dehydrogenase